MNATTGRDPADPATTEADVDSQFDGRFMLRGVGLRQHAARGTIVNAGFQVGLSLLAVVRGFVVAVFLTRSEYGLWGILVVSLGTILWLKQVGIGDKYIQQDDADQELAFQKAFTLEAMFTGIFIVVLAAAVPLVALLYGRWEILAPGLALVAVLPAVILQTPLWVFYRQMRFLRQRALQAIDPIVGFAVAVGLAVAGAGYWSLVVATLAGAWAAAIAAVRSSPYPLRLRYDRGTLRSYVSFSWPLLIGSASGMVIAQTSILAGEQVLGLAGAGAIALAATIVQFGETVDQVVTGTLYPAICAVRDRTELLFESFTKSNRLAMTCAFPFGVAVALFGSDLVHYGLGERWRPAVTLLEVMGVAAAINQIAFNWHAYFRARGDTRPMAVVGTLSMVSFLAVAVPLLIAYGLDGFAVGVGVMTLTALCARTYYVRRLFHGFAVFRHGLRAIAPTALASVVVLGMRGLEPSGRTVGVALGELALYLIVVAGTTLAFERSLLREAAGYVRHRPHVAGAA